MKPPYTKARGLVVDTPFCDATRGSASPLHRVTTAIDCEADPFAATRAPLSDRRRRGYSERSGVHRRPNTATLFQSPTSRHVSPDRRNSVRHVERRHARASRRCVSSRATPLPQTVAFCPRYSRPRFHCFVGHHRARRRRPAAVRRARPSTHWFTLNDVPFPPWRQVVPQHSNRAASRMNPRACRRCA